MYCILCIQNGEPGSLCEVDDFEAGRQELLNIARRIGTAEDIQVLRETKEEDGEACIQTESLSYWLLMVE